MATTEERMRILKMVAEKQITAEEGARLLEALRASSGASRRAAASLQGPMAAHPRHRPAQRPGEDQRQPPGGPGGCRPEDGRALCP